MSMLESFRGPFLATAWKRYARIVDWVERGELAGLRSAASELHCLSGEAAMLALSHVADAARHAEKAARDEDIVELASHIRDLHVAIKAVEASAS